jgi:hypothetical protein
MMIALAGIIGAALSRGIFRDGIAGGVSSSVCGTLLARADEVIERSGHLFEPRLIDNPGEVGFGSSTSFQAQAAHFRFSPDFGHIAASHRSAANLLTRDEARLIAANVAKLLRRKA